MAEQPTANVSRWSEAEDRWAQLKLTALLRMNPEHVTTSAARAWSSIPHVLGASVVVEYQWCPADGLEVTVGSSSSGLSGFVAALGTSHELTTLTGVARKTSKDIEEVATVERRGLVLDQAASRHPSYVPRSAGESLAADHLAATLQTQRRPILIRFVATATQLSPDEEEAVVSSFVDHDSGPLARTIRRAEGALYRADRLFSVLPPFEVGVYVGGPQGATGDVAAALAAALGANPAVGSPVSSPEVQVHPADSARVTGFFAPFAPPESMADIRLVRLFGRGELHTIMLLPFATGPTFPGLPVRRSRLRDRSAGGRIAAGLLLGSARNGHTRSGVHLDDADLARHLVLTGQTGTGKSRTLESLALQQAASGAGFAFIDPHGDSVERLIERLPRHRLDDVVVLDPSTESGRLAINPLQADSVAGQEFVVQDLSEMFYDLFDPARQGIVGPRFEAWLRMGALTLLDAAANGAEPASIIDIPRLFSDDDFLRERVGHVTDPYVEHFWLHEMRRTAEFHRSEMLGWFASKFDRFASNRIMRDMLASGRNDLDLGGLMDAGGLLLVRLPKGLIGEVNASLLGYFLNSRIWTAALARAATPHDQRRPFTLFIDEFQSFTSATAIGSMLSEARKFRLRLVLANQFQSQLDPRIRGAVDGNCGNRLTFRVGAQDAEVLAPLYSGVFDAEDLTHLPNLHAAAIVLDAGEVQTPFTLSIADGP